jgi:hypothetical protein
MNTMNLNIDNKIVKRVVVLSYLVTEDKPKNKMNDGMVYRLTIAKKNGRGRRT